MANRWLCAFKYEPLDTSVLKLRKKYVNLKTEWRKISDRAKTGSGLAPEKEPKWYNHINEIFSETNADLDLAAESGDLSFTRQFSNLNYSDEDSDKPSDKDASDETVCVLSLCPVFPSLPKLLIIHH